MLRKALILSSFTTLVIAWNLPTGYEHLFFKLLAVGLCLVYGAFIVTSDKVEKAIALFITGMAISNLCDELWFDPHSREWNEYLGAVLAMFLTYLEHKGVDQMIKLKVRSWLKRVNFGRKN